MDDGGAVEHLIVHGDRQPDDGEAAEARRRVVDETVPGPRRRAAQERRLVEQVVAGVAGQRQLGEDDDRDALGLSAVEQLKVAVALARGSANVSAGTAAATRTNP